MVIMYLKFGVKGRSKRSTKRFEPKTQPISTVDLDPVSCMFSSMRSLKAKLKSMTTNVDKSWSLNITDGNAQPLKILSEFIKEVDIDRKLLLFAE